MNAPQRLAVWFIVFFFFVFMAFGWGAWSSAAAAMAAGVALSIAVYWKELNEFSAARAQAKAQSDRAGEGE